jgi:hypothetical protein
LLIYFGHSEYFYNICNLEILKMSQQQDFTESEIISKFSRQCSKHITLLHKVTQTWQLWCTCQKSTLTNKIMADSFCGRTPPKAGIHIWFNHVITLWHSVTNPCIVYYTCISSIIKNWLTRNCAFWHSEQLCASSYFN